MEDLHALCLIFGQNKRMRAAKYMYKRKNWADHVNQLLETDEFENRFRMPKEHFDHLLEQVRECITVDYLRSVQSTGGNKPMYPEAIMVMGLRFLGIGSTITNLADLYGVSVPSARRAVNMFLDAIDYNTTFAELQISLSSPNDSRALDALAFNWASKSTAYGLFTHILGAIDGWLPRTEMPADVSNQHDYFSGHYQCYGLNVQAMCDPDLIFLYMSVAAPGKVNDICAFKHCNGSLEWLEALPLKYHIVGDNA